MLSLANWPSIWHRPAGLRPIVPCFNRALRDCPKIEPFMTLVPKDFNRPRLWLLSYPLIFFAEFCPRDLWANP
jgi:hypothetical protein